MPSVIVSGATGFIAQHVVKVLLAKNYEVVGTVRSTQKGDHLAKLLNNKNFSYEVVADIGKKGAFDDVLEKHQDAEVFLHTASPFHFNVTDVEKDLLHPAVEGTINALEAIAKHGKNIKNVVVTSSFASVMDLGKNDGTYTEADWNPITWEESKANALTGYIGSKKFAEQAAWKFVKDNKVNFKINYVLPVYVFGPQAFDSEVKDNLNTSSEILNGFVKAGAEGSAPEHTGFFVDVRDVADAHVVAFEKGLENERLLLSAGAFDNVDVLDVLTKQWPDRKFPKANLESRASPAKIDNSKTKKQLGFELRDLKTTVVDSVEQIFDAQK